MEHYFTNATNLKSEIKILKYQKDQLSFTFFSDNGVFAKNKIDYGSSFLIDTILKNEKREITDILDVGCGYGFLGIVLSKFYNAKCLMVDINKRALHLTERNIKENKVLGQTKESDAYLSVTGEYDLIVTNPPIRAGKSVCLEILQKAKNYLKEDGALWFVMRKDHGVKSIIKILESDYKINIVDKSKGFYIIEAKNVLTKNGK